MIELVPLRIPKGWAVLDNKFYDVDPKLDEDGFIINWEEGFMDDVLWITECKLLDSGKMGMPESNCFSIDLGWYPESTIKGGYSVSLFLDSKDRIEIDSYSNQNRFLIKDKIEFWMKDISENYSEYKKLIALNGQ